MRWTIVVLAAIIALPSVFRAQTPPPSADTEECGEDTPAKAVIVKTPTYTNALRAFRAYGEISYSRISKDGAESRCRVVSRLYAANGTNAFRKIKEMVWETEAGEISGVDLIGLSPDGSKFAADFWLAEGDGEEHRPVVHDIAKDMTLYLPLEARIQKRIDGCDQNEDFIGVSNEGEAVFAIPPSHYDDSAACGDKGVWRFNLTSGHVYRIARTSTTK